MITYLGEGRANQCASHTCNGFHVYPTPPLSRTRTHTTVLSRRCRLVKVVSDDTINDTPFAHLPHIACCPTTERVPIPATSLSLPMKPESGTDTQQRAASDFFQTHQRMVIHMECHSCLRQQQHLRCVLLDVGVSGTVAVRRKLFLAFSC